MKVALLIFICLATAISPTPVFAKNQWIDSLKRVLPSQKDTNRIWTLIALGDGYGFTEPDTGFQYASEAYQLAEKLDYDKGRLYSLISINNSLYSMGNYTLELDYAFKLLPLSKRMDDINAKGFCLGAVGDSYSNLGEFAMALPYYRQVLQIGIAANLPELHRMYTGLIPVFIGLHQYDSAVWYAQKGYALFKASPYYTSNDGNTYWSEMIAFLSLAQVMEVKENYDSSLYFFRKSVVASHRIDARVFELTALLGMAGVFRQQSKFDSAIIYAQKILHEKNRSIYPSGKQKSAELLAAIYQQQGQTDSSLKYLTLSIGLKDSLYNHAKMMAFQNIWLKENERQHAIVAATTALQNRYRLYFILTGLLIALIITAITLRARRQKQLQVIRNTIAHDLHDEVGSALSSISIMSELAKAKSPDALPLLVSIGENTTAIQENMSDIIWAVNPTNDHFDNMLQRMNLFASEILDAKGIRLSFNADTSLNKISLDMQRRKNFYLFFKEAINNAAKHSGAKEIMVNLVRHDKGIGLTIRDDGRGFDTSTGYNGNGLHSLQKRATELKADYSIESALGTGTVIYLKFKTY